MMGWELTFLTRIDDEDLTITHTSGPAEWVAPGSVVPLEDTLCFRMLAGVAPPVTDRASEIGSGYHDAPTCSALGIESYSGHPVRRGDGSVVGTLCAIDRRRRIPTVEARRLGDTFASLLAWELDREAVLSELGTRARTDPLTGLANHGTLFERLGAEVARASRHGRALSLVMLDLDHFKRVNDTRGHPAGDLVLKEVARRLGSVARAEDLVARVGGEEFAWLLPETGRSAAWQAAEKARASIAAEPMPGDLRVTISAGIAELSHAGDETELYRLADRALYWAKRHGRNLSFGYSPEGPEPLDSDQLAERLANAQAHAALCALAAAVDAKDPSTQRHSERVADLTAQLAIERDWSAGRIALLREVALVHDVGKIGVPDRILFKPERLSEEERAHVREHSSLGAQIASNVLGAEQTAWLRGHHERWDGLGYPDGIAGTTIPEGARLLALADAWDAMTSVRSYQPARSPEHALRECVEQEGRHLCPNAVAALRACWTGLVSGSSGAR